MQSTLNILLWVWLPIFSVLVFTHPYTWSKNLYIANAIRGKNKNRSTSLNEISSLPSPNFTWIDGILPLFPQPFPQPRIDFPVLRHLRKGHACLPGRKEGTNNACSECNCRTSRFLCSKNVKMPLKNVGRCGEQWELRTLVTETWNLPNDLSDFWVFFSASEQPKRLRSGWHVPRAETRQWHKWGSEAKLLETWTC